MLAHAIAWRTEHDSIMSFRTDQSGSISIIFAGTIILLLGVIALAVDGGNAMRTRQQIQSAMDAAALAAARTKMMGGDAEAAIDASLAANWSNAHPDLPIEVNDVSIADGVVRIVAQAKSPAILARIVGLSDLNMSLDAEATYGVGDVEIALVLDNTRSMEGAKLDALKQAAHTLVDEVTAAPNADQHVRISLVPFGQYVNVGLGYRGSNWLSVPDDSSSTTNQCWNTYPNAVSSNCHDVEQSYDDDGVIVTYTSNVCDWDYGDPVEVCGDVTTTHTWNGCVGSRSGTADLSDAVTPADPVPGLPDTWCNSPLTRLGSDFAALSNEIDAQVATGVTYIPSGLLWGWRTLSHNPPFADGVDPAAKPDIRKIIVLMTDGENTRSATAPSHDGWVAADANGITADLCAAIKDANVTVYTVSFAVDDADTLALLSNCASNPINAYNADNAEELEQAFESIGGAIVALRLSK